MTKVRALRTLLVLTVASIAAACTVHQSAPPGLTGPSDFAVSLNVVASPDSIFQDGGSQSTVRVTAKGPDGKPYAALSLRIDMQLNDVVQDFGTLSARNIVTGGDGTASVVYTAPPPSTGNTGTCESVPGTCVTILATPVGFDFTGAVPRSTKIRLVPVGVILPPAADPTPAFSFSPASPQANSPVAFDASASCGGEADPNGGCKPTVSPIVSYGWTFGDGGTGSGKTTTHTYSRPGPYIIMLTVTNDRGFEKSTTKTVTVIAGTPPTALFAFSPAKPLPGQLVSFNASLSTAAPGHSIVSYSWDFGDGTIVAGKTATHTFDKANTYNVVLVVTDDAGLTGASTQGVVVAVPTTTGTTSKR